MNRPGWSIFRSVLFVVSCLLAASAFAITFIPALAPWEYLRMPSMIFCFAAVLGFQALDPKPRAG